MCIVRVNNNVKKILGITVLIAYIVLAFVAYRVYQHVTRETYVPFQELQIYFTIILLISVILSALYAAAFIRKKS